MQFLRAGLYLSPWEYMMVKHAQVLESLRLEVMGWLRDVWMECEDLAQTITISSERGYEEGDSAALILQQRAGDLRRRYAKSLPHRYDIGYCWQQSPYHHLSLGHQKMIITELMLISAKIDWQKAGKKALWLMGDVASELDDHSRRTLLAKLEQLDVQCMMTALDAHWKYAHSNPIELLSSR